MSVYFILAPSIGRVKIGHSEKPWARFSKIQSDTPFPVVMAHVADGGLDEEAAFHARFADARVHAEWFNARNPDLAEFLGSVTAPTKPFCASKHAMRPTDLASAMGWSVPYASQVLNDKRPASLQTALSVYDRTGLRLGALNGLSDAEIDVARKVAAPTQQDAAA